MHLTTVGKWMVCAGLGIVVLGAVVWLSGKTNLPLGRLPGDVHVERGRFSLYFPIVTCIVLSIVLTVILMIVSRLFHR